MSQTMGIEQSLENHITFEHGEPSETILESRRKVLVLARYVRRHRSPKKIIEDQIGGIMTRNKLQVTCFVTEFEPRSIKGALNYEIQIEVMNESIKKIERKNT